MRTVVWCPEIRVAWFDMMWEPSWFDLLAAVQRIRDKRARELRQGRYDMDYTPPLVASGRVYMKVRKGTLPEMDWDP